MRASFKTHNDGTVALNLDTEAARAVFASVVFAAKSTRSSLCLPRLRRKDCEERNASQQDATQGKGMPNANDLRGTR
jgi:hypothetical protein